MKYYKLNADNTTYTECSETEYHGWMRSLDDCYPILKTWDNGKGKIIVRFNGGKWTDDNLAPAFPFQVEIASGEFRGWNETFNTLDAALLYAANLEYNLYRPYVQEVEYAFCYHAYINTHWLRTLGFAGTDDPNRMGYDLHSVGGKLHLGMDLEINYDGTDLRLSSFSKKGEEVDSVLLAERVATVGHLHKLIRDIRNLYPE